MSQQRLAGILIVVGILSAIVWRVVAAPAVLGSFDSSNMPHHDRAFLAIGNILVATAFASAIDLLSGLCTKPAAQRAAQLARLCGLGAAICAVTGTIGLVWQQAAINAIVLFSVLMAAAWVLIGFALYQQFHSSVGLLAVLTGIVYAVAAAAIVVADVHIVFVMTISLLPLAVVLLVSSRATSAMPQQSPGHSAV